MAVNQTTGAAAPHERGALVIATVRRFKFALVALIVLAAWISDVGLLHRAAAELPKLTDAELIRRYAERLAGVKATLSPTSTVGYLSDREPRDAVTDPYGVALYYITQYTLAPVVVSLSLEPPLVIGNFEQPAAAAEAAGAHQLTVVKNFGNGVFLFRRP